MTHFTTLFTFSIEGEYCDALITLMPFSKTELCFQFVKRFRCRKAF